MSEDDKVVNLKGGSFDRDQKNEFADKLEKALETVQADPGIVAGLIVMMRTIPGRGMVLDYKHANLDAPQFLGLLEMAKADFCKRSSG